MADVEKRRKALINIAYIAVILVIAFFAIRYASGVCLPFAIAFVVAAMLQKPKNFLVRKTFLKKGSASGLCVLLAIVVIIALVSLIGVRLFNEIKSFIEYIAVQIGDLEKAIDSIENWLLNRAAALPSFVRSTLTDGINSLFVRIRDAAAGDSNELAEQIKNGLSGSFTITWITAPLSGVITTASKLPSIFVSVIISIVACCFMTAEFPEIVRFISLQFPKERRDDLTRAKTILKGALGKMGKAYLLIMLITFIEMTVGLTVLRIIGVFESNYLILIAALTAVVDIFPILGTGTVIAPWAIFSFITGNVGMGIGLIVIYAVISVLRQVIEPKLVAGQLGLSPIVTIAALYLGLKMFGFIGMFLLPILIIMLKLLNDEGIIRIWKTQPADEAKSDVHSEKEEQEKKDEPEGKEKTVQTKKGKTEKKS